ncbi:hypothetical protein [Portibacter lacus]|uniref:Uncharacterized protein n=1 Tax=Portibacter lacus TaxID=1099794 RepID=A0AA37WEC1_9BACT|nr:hypothetical protein [Portibacter lacus]GLR16559.1 hypothetical protein GCM10007940_11740 [Portibacter lacus]
MKKRKYEVDDAKKVNSMAAAENFEATESMQPPSFFATAQQVETQAGVTQDQLVQDTSGQAENQMEEQSEAPSNYATIKPNRLFGAMRAGHEYFKAVSSFQNVEINGSKAYGDAGCLSAPNIEPLIFGELSGEMVTYENREMAKAVSKVTAYYLDQWRAGFHIPGLNWYPLFNYFPGPVAPPMPNIPTPLAICPSFGEFLLTKKQMMIQDIMNALPSKMRNDINSTTVSSYCNVTVDYYNQWLNTDYLTNMVGYGPIPGFKPPFSYGGQVRGGRLLPKFGVLN